MAVSRRMVEDPAAGPANTTVKNTARFVLAGGAALVVAAVWSHPAHAWTWARGVTVYSGAGLCVRGDAGVDHFRPGSFSGNLAYANAYALSGGCGGGVTKPDGSAAVRLEVYRWNGSAWAVCRSTGWTYGPTGVSGGEPYGPSQVFDYGGAACGAGFYGTMAYPYVWDGSAWRGGGVWSGYEYVP
ncbi:hypothetical protein SAMN05421505_11869 [Sinosporangium album]|uniref:Uncharacterized protein n=1 Tax=Sinosporangium album TaxID=504805 RepID=A0A1G8DIY7_9ACTN|nr:hypothetical protein [Sinosporangium album]SDH57612.1 hypothetical protein SAMN05421505_11869 [Sinosporangium album]